MDPDRRKYQYSLLSDIAKDLLNEIYHNEEGFATTRYITVHPTESKFVGKFGIHPLESHIINYDQNMENQGIIINIGHRIGFDLRYDDTEAYPPEVQFYDRCSYTIRNNSAEQIEKIINMNLEEYKNYIESKGYLFNQGLYLDRLNVDSHKYLPSLIESINSEEVSPLIPSVDEIGYYDDEIVSNMIQVIPAPSVPSEIGEEKEDEIDKPFREDDTGYDDEDVDELEAELEEDD